MEKLPRISKEVAHKFFFYTGIFLILGAVGGTVVSTIVGGMGAKAPRAIGGALDLRDWDFASDKSVPLGGEWRFIPNELVTQRDFIVEGERIVTRRVPDTKIAQKSVGSTGSGTYRLTVLLPVTEERLAIRFAAIRTAFEMEINGTIIARAGEPSMDANIARAAYKPGIVQANGNAGILDIVVRVSNHEYRWGGIARTPELGGEKVLRDAKQGDDIRILLVTGALLGIACNSFFIFVFRRKERAYLYFSVFAALIALRALSTGDYLIITIFRDLPFDALIRLNYLSIFLLIPLGTLFFSHIFPEDIKKAELVSLIVPSLAFSLLIPIAPLKILTWSLLPYALIGVGSAVYGFIVVGIRPVLRGRAASKIVLAAGIILFVSTIANALYAIFVSLGEHGFPLGLPMFVIIQTFALAKRFTRAFDTVETLSDQLQSANASLETEINQSMDARHRLEIALTEKDLLLKEVHHRVKNSLQIVTSIINLQVHRTKDSAALEAYRSVSDRIRAISAVHDKLYGLESEKHIKLKNYVQDLIRQFTTSYGEESAKIDLHSDDIDVPMDLCMELGLVLTELVVNAYRHAIIPEGGGSIRVELKKNGEVLSVLVADDGPGFPDDFDLGEVSSVGFRIVTSLIRKREGDIQVSSGPGATVSIHIPFDKEIAA